MNTHTKHAAKLKSWVTYKKANTVLAFLIIVVNLYVLASPFVPQLRLVVRKQHVKAVAGLPYKTVLDSTPATDTKRAEIPKDNRIVIPKIALDEAIFQGTSPYLVNKGVWARPATSTPPKGGNTVLVGHRFTYSGPATFYSLDKVAVGDTIVMYWQSKEYDYVVSQTKVVQATAVEIEDPTTDAQLTIYTCTPLWSAKDRLVVIAKLQQDPSHE
jgi:LPXTG-site transpeptidase (sortase) family protein